jgi:hypothetical protein
MVGIRELDRTLHSCVRVYKWPYSKKNKVELPRVWTGAQWSLWTALQNVFK